MIGELLAPYIPRRPQMSVFRQRVLVLAIGAAAYTLLTNIPLPAMGLIIELITALAGVGAVMMYFRSTLNTFQGFAPRAPARQPRMAPVTVSLPASAPEPGDRLPGMENLPEGFSGFDEDW